MQHVENNVRSGYQNMENIVHIICHLCMLSMKWLEKVKEYRQVVSHNNYISSIFFQNLVSPFLVENNFLYSIGCQVYCTTDGDVSIPKIRLGSRKIAIFVFFQEIVCRILLVFWACVTVVIMVHTRF